MALPADDEYDILFNAAREAREDGDHEECVLQLTAMLALFPDDAEVTAALARAFISLKKFAEANLCLERALAKDPADHILAEIWATMPLRSSDWDEQIRRDILFRANLPASQKHLAKQSLIFTLVAYWESGRWADAAAFVHAQREGFIADTEVFGVGVQILGLLGQIEQIQALVDAAPPSAWSWLPPGAPERVRLRLDQAARNRMLVQNTGIRLVSLGQHCLPYQLGARWGFNHKPVDPHEITPFSLGSFPGDSTAAAIVTDFGTFADRAQFATVPNWSGCMMYRHHGSGVHYHHERGPYWLENDGARFFERWDRMLSSWRQISRQGRRLFVFCLVGEGDLNVLVNAVDKHLLDRTSRLLVINVLKNARPGPEHERVTYLHAPYPDDYDWVELRYHASERGYAFETVVADAFRAEIMKLDAEPNVNDDSDPDHDGPLDAAAFDPRADRNMKPPKDAEWAAKLREAAHKARTAGQLENAISLLGMLLDEVPGDAAAMIAQAQILSDLKRSNEAAAILDRALAQAPDDFALRKIWAEEPIHSADWNETIKRGQYLREFFPPAIHPKSYHSLIVELAAYYDSGRWEEAVNFIHQHWQSFTRRPELLSNALDVLGTLCRPHGVRDLLDSAAPAALQELDVEIIPGISRITDAALENQRRLRAHDARVISLGHNAQCYLFAGRWGLSGGPARYNALTPFDIGNFSAAAAAEAVATDFAAYSRQEDFIEAPAWFGGVMLVHQPTGTNFLSYRRARWSAEDRAQFFAHWNMMVTNWRRTRNQGQRVFVISLSDGADLPWIVASLSESLLDARSHLVMVDMRAQPEAFAAPDRVTYLSAPPPRHYAWPRLTACAMPEVIAYEQCIVAAITAQLPR